MAFSISAHASPRLASFGSAAVLAGAAALLLTVATAYTLSRSIGLPGLTHTRSRFDTLGTFASLMELAAAVVVRRTLRRRDS